MNMPNVFRIVGSKHIFMMWFAICLCYGYRLWEEWIDAVREREWRIINLLWYFIYKENGLNFGFGYMVSLSQRVDLDIMNWCSIRKHIGWSTTQGRNDEGDHP